MRVDGEHASRAPLIAALERHTPYDAHEAEMRVRILEFVRGHEDCFERSQRAGHVTGSAWIVDTKRTRALLTHHAKLNKWLQPGGHCDGDGDVARVALREAQEETGIQHLRVWGDAIFDVDAHEIPARGEEPAHVHYDIRYLIEAPADAPLVVSDESHELVWVALEDVEKLNTDASVLRMVARTRAL
ncbi:MAG: NUDIX hydrolase [Candidatus Solibacter sp.]|nr:NUDIX hydrolase [Candidatus Solibacter sp.]